MYIYNPNNEPILTKRIKEAESILKKIPAKHCFITGSFLYKEDCKDIDIFIISRSKRIKDKNITKIDFNDLYSLFFHSVVKTCISKNPIPYRPIKVTVADYWNIINEAVPTILNQKQNYKKDIRFLILYTEYLKHKEVLGTFDLNRKIDSFNGHKEVLEYINKNVPGIINSHSKNSYIRRYFYSLSKFYKEYPDEQGQVALRSLALSVIHSSKAF